MHCMIHYHTRALECYNDDDSWLLDAVSATATINHPDSEKGPLPGRDKKLPQTILVSQPASAKCVVAGNVSLVN